MRSPLRFPTPGPVVPVLPVPAFLMPLLLMLVAAAPLRGQTKKAVEAGAADPSLQAPRIVDLRVNNGDVITSRASIRLEHQVLGNATHYRAGEHPQLAGAPWQAYVPSPQYELSQGNGPKVVYFQVRNGSTPSQIHAVRIAMSNPLVTQVRVSSVGGNDQSVGQIMPGPGNTAYASVTYRLEGDATDCWISTNPALNPTWQPCRPDAQVGVVMPFAPPGDRVVYVQARGPNGESNVMADTIRVETLTYATQTSGWVGMASGHPEVRGACPPGTMVSGINADRVVEGVVRNFYASCRGAGATLMDVGGQPQVRLGWTDATGGFNTSAPHPEPVDLQDLVRLLLPVSGRFEFFDDYQECPAHTWVEGVNASLSTPSPKQADAVVGLTMICSGVDNRGGRSGAVTVANRVTGTLTGRDVALRCPYPGVLTGLHIVADWTVRGIRLECAVPTNG